ncbi:ArsR/SmtB family transcription factor [Nocardioides sp. GXQ0305]|jgi:DNA-binding transcriptional ArsR family regulator|uniref:ArsR/SmtB family transcription factor n=1 Tax=Nocardioides sp. GXQ0305 TaxID=3423912 RepID=UPI003D7C5661
MTIDQTLAALADPTRRGIVQRLAHGRASAGQLAALSQFSRPATSQHLRVLRDAGVVRRTSGSRQSPYELDPATLIVLESWLSGLVDTWRTSPLPGHVEKTRGAVP